MKRPTTWNAALIGTAATALALVAMALSVTPPTKAGTNDSRTAAPAFSGGDISAFAFGNERNAPAQSSAPAGRTVSTHGEAAVFALEIEADGKVSVSEDRATGGVSMARADMGGDLFPSGRALSPADKLNSFLERHGNVFGIRDAASQLRMIDVGSDQYGFTRVTYQQVHGDVPVFGAVMHGHVSADGRLIAVNGKFVPGIELPAVPGIGRSAASRTATSAVSAQLPSALKGAELDVASARVFVYRQHLTRGTPGANHLAYEIEVTHGGTVREFVYVDAVTGKVIDQITGIQASHANSKHRTVFQSEYDPSAPQATMVWDEANGDPVHDAVYSTRPAPVDQLQSVEDEVSGAGYSYNLFLNLSRGVDPATGTPNEQYAWRSWDGNNAEMLTVNTDPTIVCPNANWNGTSTNYCIGTTADDVVAHEWGHAYTQETSGLIYAWQSGALNESYSDIWGETVDLLNNREGINGPANAATGNDGPRSQDESICSDFNSETNPGSDPSYRWLVGEDAFAFGALPPAGDNAIRDMWNPQCATGEVGVFVPDPGHVTSDNYHCSESDGGGVHTNSAINNRAFAMLVDGNTLELRDDGTPFDNPVTVTGIGLTKAAHIFWRANSRYNTPASNFADNADSLMMACQDLAAMHAADSAFRLTKLVTSVEQDTPGEDATRLEDANNDRIDPPVELSDEFITSADCDQVANAIAAVEMREDVTKQCGFKPLLSQAPAPMCGNAEVQSQYDEDFASGFFGRGWSTDGTSVNPATKSTANWVESTMLPNNPDGSLRLGSAAFQENRRDYGNCADDDESGQQWLESPPITLDAEDSQFLVFEHYFHSEISYDGGNVMISVDDGANWSVIPASAFVHNPYNGSLEPAISDAPNTGPKAGEEAWHGSNAGEIGGDWGESQIDLTAIDGVGPGATIRLRWDFGQDGCNGSDEGWYVDRMEVFSCGPDTTPPTEVCNVYPADGFLPVVGSPIVSLVGSTTTATVSGEMSAISDANIINLTGSHTYMGDLTFELESPAGTTVTLFDGANCGAEDGINIEFDDEADSVAGCGDWTSGGTFRPFEALAAFDGQDGNGDWTLTVLDGFPQDEGQVDSWAVELCTPIDPQENLPPVANADEATTSKNTATEIPVLANDSDPEGGSLSVVSASDPVNGSVVINMDNTITYVPDPDYVGTDNFLYTIEDEEGAQDTASVSITVTDDGEEEASDKATGGGWMAASDGGKINFGFNAKQKTGGPQGNLQLNDKSADVKIHIKNVTLIQAASSSCDGISTDGNSLEFLGTGEFNKADASFRVCVEDNGEPGNGNSGGAADRFFLECTGGCGYSTSARVNDNELDGGNIQVQRASKPEQGTATGSGSGDSSGGNSGGNQSASGTRRTVILDPVLLTEGTVGALQLFAVKVYGPDQELLAGEYVQLQRVLADGSSETFDIVTGPAGSALLSIAVSPQPSEFTAFAGGTDSNRVELTPVLY